MRSDDNPYQSPRIVTDASAHSAVDVVNRQRRFGLWGLRSLWAIPVVGLVVMIWLLFEIQLATYPHTFEGYPLLNKAERVKIWYGIGLLSLAWLGLVGGLIFWYGIRPWRRRQMAGTASESAEIASSNE